MVLVNSEDWREQHPSQRADLRGEKQAQDMEAETMKAPGPLVIISVNHSHY